MLLYNTTLDGNEEARDQNRTQISRKTKHHMQGSTVL